jgi:hypothetical protein
VPIPFTREQFGKWLSGFIDAEGNFQVFFDQHYLRVAFRITLHIDDIQILYKIQKYLGVGKVRAHKTYCVFSISNLFDLINILFPLLNQYPLYTTKYLDYLDFKYAVELLSNSKSTRIEGNDLLFVNILIQNMNQKRKSYNYSLIPPIISLNPN